MSKYKWLDITTAILLVVGGINWGLEALHMNLVEALSNAVGFQIITPIIYYLIFGSALWVGARSLMGKFMRR